MKGYDKFSFLLSKYPELALLRRFGRLSTKCLLYRQAELTWLEDDIDFLARKSQSSHSEKSASTSWDYLMHGENDQQSTFYRTKVEQLHEKLQAYHATLLQTAEVFKLNSAQPADLQELRKWLARDEGGGHFLDGTEREPWAEGNEGDLVALVPSTVKGDRFAHTMRNRFLPIYHRWVGERRKPRDDPELGPVWEYDSASLTLVGNVLCMLLSFAMPTGSIFALYFIRPTLVRLSLLSVFIFVFAFAMMFVVGNRRGEVFAATAAFAAIQVVFVGGVNIIQQS